MTIPERLVADYSGTGLTVGPHPMTFRRHDLSMRGVLPAIDLPRARAGRRVRTAGMVITRQRPGTAKGFVFLTLEDETGIANIIIRPDLYASDGSRLSSRRFSWWMACCRTRTASRRSRPSGSRSWRAYRIWPPSTRTTFVDPAAGGVAVSGRPARCALAARRRDSATTGLFSATAMVWSALRGDSTINWPVQDSDVEDFARGVLDLQGLVLGSAGLDASGISQLDLPALETIHRAERELPVLEGQAAKRTAPGPRLRVHRRHPDAEGAAAVIRCTRHRGCCCQQEGRKYQGEPGELRHTIRKAISRPPSLTSLFGRDIHFGPFLAGI